MGLIWRSSPFRNQPLWLRASGAALLVLGIYALSLALGLPQHGARFLLLYPAVFACALLAGRDAGIAGTIVGSITVAVHLALHPELRVDVPVAMGSLILFLIAGVGVSLLLSELKRSLRGMEAANAQLKRAHSAAVSAEETTDLLLSELRHRVRNDLSNVIAILRLQARSLGSEEAAGHLQSAADRLQVLAKLHQALSRHGSSAVVNMKDFLHEISTHFRTTMLPLRPVALISDVEPLKLPSERALPAGLIVNELLTNAIKYAYPEDREGTISVSLKVEGGVATLAVEDDGTGFSASGEAAEAGSGLGHKLVRSLTGQLRGKFYCESTGTGTRCKVIFPVED